MERLREYWSPSHAVGLEPERVISVYETAKGLHPTQWAWNKDPHSKALIIAKIGSPSHAVGLKLSNSYWTYGRTYTSPSHTVGLERAKKRML